nr:MAG TPA: hypothetical protein [Caudoviricetes sp.]
MDYTMMSSYLLFPEPSWSTYFIKYYIIRSC